MLLICMCISANGAENASEPGVNGVQDKEIGYYYIIYFGYRDYENKTGGYIYTYSSVFEVNGWLNTYDAKIQFMESMRAYRWPRIESTNSYVSARYYTFGEAQNERRSEIAKRRNKGAYPVFTHDFTYYQEQAIATDETPIYYPLPSPQERKIKNYEALGALIGIILFLLLSD